MLAKLKRLFDTLSEPKSTQDTLHLTQIASASLLISVAKADREFGQSELDAIIATARHLFALNDAETEALIELATQNQEAATSLYEFTAAINQAFDDGQKYALIKAMWQVALADGLLDKHEEHLIRRVADLIHVRHMQFIQAKLEALQSSQETQ